MVGMGGLGSIVAPILVRSGVESLTLLDDDCVELSNLHRQLIYRDADIGQPKIACAKAWLNEEAERYGHKAPSIETHATRLLPDNAECFISNHHVVIEGADNLATKFLVADTALRCPDLQVVQAGATRWQAWTLAWQSHQGPCLRCLFEDIPEAEIPNCADAGILGSVVGVIGALQAALALRCLHQDPKVIGELWHYDAWRHRLRRRQIQPRIHCTGCQQRVHKAS